jgi:hypothetical protein
VDIVLATLAIAAATLVLAGVSLYQIRVLKVTGQAENTLELVKLLAEEERRSDRAAIYAVKDGFNDLSSRVEEISRAVNW